MSAAGPDLRLQPLARARVASLGEEGAAWLAGLPQRLEELTTAWSLTLGRALPGGSASYVVAARTAAGTDAVLKLGLPEPGLAAQVATLQRAAGRGYARLLAVDPGRDALLLEALGPSLATGGPPVEDQLRLLADTLALAWQPVAAAPGAVVLDKAGQLAELVARLWAEQGGPVPRAVLDQALRCADRCRLVAKTELVVVHGDPHPGNLLRARTSRPGAETGWCFVDPDGFVTDRAYDLGVVLRDWSGHLTGPGARGRLAGWCTLLAEHTGVDAARIWDWAYLERVSTGLHVGSFGAARAAAPFLRSAEQLL